MTTSLNSTSAARDASYQLVHYLRKAINVTMHPTGTVVEVGKIPASAIVLANASGIYVTVEFTGTTNALNVGYAEDSLSTQDADAYASAVVLPITTAGHYLAFDDMALSTARARAIDTKITATWTGTATTGGFEVVIAYLPNR